MIQRILNNLLFAVITLTFIFAGQPEFSYGNEFGQTEEQRKPNIDCSNVTASPQILTFKKQGKFFISRNLEELKKIISSDLVTVYEAGSDSIKTFRGFKFLDLISELYGTDITQFKDIQFEATDGYKPAIPLETIKSLPAYLVYEHGRSEKKFILKQNILHGEECVPLGPFYLVWDNLTLPELFKDDKSTHWPYQIEVINLINFGKKYHQLIPPSDSPANVRSGFASFKLYCLKCHSYNSKGGEKASDLKDSTKNYGMEELKKVVSNPQSVNPDATMFVPFQEKGREKEKIIEEILAYLRFMDNQP